MRYALVLAFIAIAATVGGLAYRDLQMGPPIVLPAPAGLQVSASGTQLQPGGWTNSPSVDFKVGEDKISAGADLEVRPATRAFTDTPTLSVNDLGQVAATCTTCLTGGEAQAHMRLPDGAYHWQARLHNGRGVSPWVRFHGVIRVDTSPPVISSLASPSDPVPATIYHSSTMRFQWQATDSGSGINGYSYRLDHSPKGSALAEVRTASTGISLNGLTTGSWYFHVRAIDHAGNWGASRTFPVRIDVTPPGLAHIHFNRYAFDPQFQPLQVSFQVTKPARAIHVGVYRQSNGTLIRMYDLANLPKGQETTVTWDGKDTHGSFAPAGNYEVYVRAIDAYGHSSVNGWHDFALDYKKIVISLGQQKLTAYDGSSVFLSSLVTTGNSKLPTPLGTFAIEGKFHPFTFHSPWPKSSPYYYAPSLTHWAMLFQSGGYFIHDAPWRSVFGPGSNTQIGAPGQNYTGSHGCVNVPPDVAYKLYHWAQVGTVVQVVP